MVRFISTRIIDGKSRKVIVDEIGNIVNRSPNKYELKGLIKYVEDTNKSRIYVSFNGQNFFWVVYNGYNKKLILDPTKEDLKGTKLKRYNHTNICLICREELERGKINDLTEKSILYPENACRKKDRKGNKTEEWICSRHCRRNYQRYDSNSQFNIIKSMRDRRTGNLKDDSNILGDDCEKLTDKLFGTKRLSVEYDNYELPLDHSPIPDGISVAIGEKLVDLSRKIPQTQGRHFTISIGAKGGWPFRSFAAEINKKYEIMILWCINEDGLRVERGYILPKEKIAEQTSISVIKIPSRGIQWYEQYRITDEKIIKKANEIWKEILRE